MSKPDDEFMQVAAIVCLDIDTLAKVAENNRWSKEDLQKQIFLLKMKKDLAISDAKGREMRYNAINVIFNIASKK